MPACRTVLVVDDEVHIRRVIEMRFARAGFTVRLAANGQEALEVLAAEPVCAMITDLTMPRMDGRALCEASDPGKAERPFLTLVVTGRISTDDAQWVAGLRDTQLIEKPFSTTRLLECVNEYVGRQA